MPASKHQLAAFFVGVCSEAGRAIAGPHRYSGIAVLLLFVQGLLDPGTQLSAVAFGAFSLYLIVVLETGLENIHIDDYRETES